MRRIFKGKGRKNPLDNTAVHPESYEAAKGLMEQCGFKLTDIGTSEMGKSKIQLIKGAENQYVKTWNRCADSYGHN